MEVQEAIKSIFLNGTYVQGVLKNYYCSVNTGFIVNYDKADHSN